MESFNHGLNELGSYGIGNTPLHRASKFCPHGQLYLKLEQYNTTGSIKARTAYFIVANLIQQQIIKPGMSIVESTSGNFGVSLALFCKGIGVNVVCLIDSTIPFQKVQLLRDAGANVRFVELGEYADYRSARMVEASRLGLQPGWVWPNQYANEAGMIAHELTTGPEIWEALKGNVDHVIASVGTGGTLCGIARALKRRHPNINVVAVEPLGSTIFGGQPTTYLSAGSGLPEPSPLLQKHGHYINRFAKISDALAIRTCHAIAHLEKIHVGITAGASVAVANQIATANPTNIVVAIIPDGSENYNDILSDTQLTTNENTNEIELHSAIEWYRTLGERCNE